MQSALLELSIQIQRTWRWRWLGIAICWFLVAGGSGFVLSMPDQYSSRAQVWVDMDTALTPLMRGLAVGTNSGAQMRIMQQTLLSTPNLEQVVRMVDLDLDAETDQETSEILQMLRSGVTIRSKGSSVFEISYIDEDAVRAREIVHAFMTIFIEGNLGQNRDDIVEAESFLAAKIDEYEARLKASEERLAIFRAQNMDILSSKSFVQRVEESRGRLADLNYQIEEAVISQNVLLAQLDSIEEFIPLDSSPAGATSTGKRIQELYSQLDEMLLKYTEEHPDVVATRLRIKQLAESYKRINGSNGSGSEDAPPRLASDVPNPAYQTAQTELTAAKVEVQRLERLRDSTQRKLDKLLNMQSIAPAVEAEAASLNRDYNIVKVRYETLLERLESARLGRAVDTETDSVRFRMVETPRVAAEPSGPPRIIYLSAVLFMAFGAGGAAALLRAQLEDNFLSSEALSSTFDLPVLGTIGRLETLSGKASSALEKMAFVAAAVLPVGFVIGTMLLIPRLDALKSFFGGLGV